MQELIMLLQSKIAKIQARSQNYSDKQTACLKWAYFAGEENAYLDCLKMIASLCDDVLMDNQGNIYDNDPETITTW